MLDTKGTYHCTQEIDMRPAIKSANLSSKPIIAVTGALLTSLIAVTTPAHADAFVSGTDTRTNFTITNQVDWQTLLSIAVPSSPHTHECMAVASADLVNPAGTGATETYSFTLSLDNANPLQNANGIEKTVELRDNPSINDPSRFPVSTNARFFLSANAAHTVRFLGIKGVGATNMVVEDSVLTLSCVD
jgi:hypothetical protein